MGDVIAFPRQESWRDRLVKAATHERDLKEQHNLALKARNGLIHQAVDNGYPQSYIAHALGISRPSVTRILATPETALVA